MSFKKKFSFKFPFSTIPDVNPTPMVNKVVRGTTTLIDLTTDTVDESKVLKGYTFHKADGTIGVGTLEIQEDIWH